MTKDTKKIIVRTLLEIAAQHGSLTIEEVSRRSNITRNTIQRNFNNEGIKGIVDYINGNIVQEINNQIFRHQPDELPLEIFADILLSVMWEHRDEAHIIYTSDLPFKPASQTVELSFSWLGERYERLVKEHRLAPIFTAKELVRFYNTYIYALLSLWLSSDVPVEPSVFKPKFLYLMKISMYDLIYKGIGH
ncbi:TetR/AcrR family transcriptional regulator [Lactococcus allomyrinae]|uniref:TetR/AcrR family transcriptional regulator n=1 Tax=Lactococcus allomyrinae TaxID=2419773 RepID=A0A387BTU9_9LACT|nr:TetR/AcrR family transcriptional regulator [Lactococcus allomyrinae]AYG01891.1 TetR/AcrR family transcriptional regulator [Lactococcus allomyrinae]